MQRQHKQNGGKCGICGDPYDGARENEAGGKYATGIITRNYTEGSVISVSMLSMIIKLLDDLSIRCII